MAIVRLIFENFRKIGTLGIRQTLIRPISTFTSQNVEASRLKLPRSWTKAGLFTNLLFWLGLKNEEEDPMITTIKRGVLCHQKAEYDKAETILHLALKVAQERQDMQAQRYIFDLLANVAFEKGDLPKAEKLFIEVTRELLSNGVAVDDNKIVAISLKLASLYCQQKEYGKAQQGYMFCIDAQGKKMQSIDLDNDDMSDLDRDTALLYGMCMELHAKYLCDRKIFKLAEEQLHKALLISEKVNGPTHIQTLILVNDIGTLQSIKKDYEDAILSFKKAINLADKNDRMTPVFYCNLGETYLLQNKIENASEACSEALKLAQRNDSSEAEKEAKICLKSVHEARREIAK